MFNVNYQKENDVMRLRFFVPIALVVLAAPSLVLSQSQRGAPEQFTATAQVSAASGASAAATVTIDIQRYTPDAERTAVETALKGGGYPAFLSALRKAPEVGTVGLGTQKWSIRWAREQSSPAGRTIVVVTDQPMFFLGGAKANAKPRAGYEVGLIRLQVDAGGMGKGEMAAAARVKPGGETGVQVDDYADSPITLTGVARKIVAGATGKN
jgi:hypothetical protein